MSWTGEAPVGHLVCRSRRAFPGSAHRSATVPGIRLEDSTVSASDGPQRLAASRKPIARAGP